MLHEPCVLLKWSHVILVWKWKETVAVFELVIALLPRIGCIKYDIYWSLTALRGDNWMLLAHRP